MAGVNNPPNLKPLIENQSAEQALDFSWLKSIAAGNKLKLEKANTDLAAVHESVNSSSAATQNAVVQSAVDSEAATNAARDLVISELTQQVNTLTAAVTTAVNEIPKSPIKSIQRGIVANTGNDANVIISAVNVEKSMLNVSCRSGLGSYSNNDKQWSISGGGYIKNSTALYIASNHSYSNQNPATIYWEVIEYV